MVAAAATRRDQHSGQICAGNLSLLFTHSATRVRADIYVSPCILIRSRLYILTHVSAVIFIHQWLYSFSSWWIPSVFHITFFFCLGIWIDFPLIQLFSRLLVVIQMHLIRALSVRIFTEHSHSVTHKIVTKLQNKNTKKKKIYIQHKEKKKQTDRQKLAIHTHTHTHVQANTHIHARASRNTQTNTAL